MAYEARLALRPSLCRLFPALLLGLLGLLASPSGSARVTPDLNAPAAAPRHFAVTARSSSGSPQSLVAAAHDLLAGTEGFTVDGASILWFDTPQSAGRYQVVGAYAFTSTLSVAALQDSVKRVEHQLGGTGAAGNDPPVVLDLQWVEGVQLEMPGLKLPSPDILGTDWGVNAFVASSEAAFADACTARTEDRKFCAAVGPKFRAAAEARKYEVAKGDWLNGKTSPAALTAWGHAHAVDEEILAVSFDALLEVDAAAQLLRGPGTVNEYGLFKAASRRLGHLTADTVMPFEFDLPPGNVQVWIKPWLERLQHLAVEGALLPCRVVVYGLQSGHVRGALVGAKGAKPQGRAPMALETVSVKEGGGAPGEPRIWSVSVTVARP